MKRIITAEARRARSKELLIKKLSGLCDSAVKTFFDCSFAVFNSLGRDRIRIYHRGGAEDAEGGEFLIRNYSKLCELCVSAVNNSLKIFDFVKRYPN